MSARKIAVIAGASYFGIFFAAVYANFFVLQSVMENPVAMVTYNGLQIRFAILAFLVAAALDVFVAWALYELYREHTLSRISTYFRIMHATIMGAAVFALVSILTLTTSKDILAQINIFNTLWLIGLFFFGIHLALLSVIIKNISTVPFILLLAGIMYIADTSAHFLLENYKEYASLFLTMVAVPSIFGEMSLAVWLLIKGGRGKPLRQTV